jgi:Thioredoxin
VDFSDFQCPKCARYVKSTEPEIKKEYVETGKIALIFKHFPGWAKIPFQLHLRLNVPTSRANSENIMMPYFRTSRAKTLAGQAKRIWVRYDIPNCNQKASYKSLNGKCSSRSRSGNSS